MFILSIIPIPLSRDSDGNTTNNTLSNLASAGQRVKDLEALYTTLVTRIIIDQNLYFNKLEGVDYSNPDSVKLQLDSARAYVQQLVSQGQIGTEDITDISSRLKEVQTKLPTTGTRINDLTLLFNALNNGTTLKDTSGRQIIISGVDNTNPLSVKAELDRALALQSELKITETFWQSMLTSRQTANKAGDFNFDGVINNNDITALQGSISGNQELNEYQKKAGDLNNDGIVNNDDLALLSSMVNPQPAQTTNSGTTNNPTTKPVINSTSINTNNNIPKWWQFFTTEEQRLLKLDDLKMTADIQNQINESGQKIKFLEGSLQSLKQSQSLSDNDGISNELSSTEKQLSREKVRYSMLKGLSPEDV